MGRHVDNDEIEDNLSDNEISHNRNPEQRIWVALSVVLIVGGILIMLFAYLTISSPRTSLTSINLPAPTPTITINPLNTPIKTRVSALSENASNKTLSLGEDWDIGLGWTLSTNSIDVKSNPKQVWIVLSKNGIKMDDKILMEGNIYKYKNNVSFAIDSIFSGTSSDMVRLVNTYIAPESDQIATPTIPEATPIRTPAATPIVTPAGNIAYSKVMLSKFTKTDIIMNV